MKAIQTSSLALTVAAVLGLGSTAHAGGRLRALYHRVVAAGGVLCHGQAINKLASEHAHVKQAMEGAIANRAPKKRDIIAGCAVVATTAVSALGAMAAAALGAGPEHVELLTSVALAGAGGLAFLGTKPQRDKVAGLKAAVEAAMLTRGGPNAPSRQAVERNPALQEIWRSIQRSVPGPTVRD